VSKLEEVKASLRNAKAQRAESRKETKMRDTIEAMTRHFTGVHGRLVDIVKPTQRRFDLALSLAMGRNMDAVVVDQESTARECIKYLRDQRAGVLTFLPLDTLQAKVCTLS
jgi:structural maintenance of chromosome 1